MGRAVENQGFVCLHCQTEVRLVTNGGYRNHCPVCLWSLHVDSIPGDRAHGCRGPMRPVGLKYRRAKGYQLVHCCERCGVQVANRVAVDTAQPDNWSLVCTLLWTEI